MLEENHLQTLEFLQDELNRLIEKQEIISNVVLSKTNPASQPLSDNWKLGDRVVDKSSGRIYEITGINSYITLWCVHPKGFSCLSYTQSEFEATNFEKCII